MFKARQILSALIVIIILSSWSSLVLAAGKVCELDGSGCPATEKCCCCGTPNDSTKTQSCPGSGKGVCFSEKVPGSITAKKPAGDLLDCGDVVCPFSKHISVKDFIDEAVNYIFYISIILAPLMIIIGAFIYLTSAGSPKQAKLGGSIIQWTAIGLAVILFAKGITAIIKMILVG